MLFTMIAVKRRCAVNRIRIVRPQWHLFGKAWLIATFKMNDGFFGWTPTSSIILLSL